MYGIFMSNSPSDSKSNTFYKIKQASEMPLDVSMCAPILTLTGSQDLVIENYRGILEYTEKLIRIQTKTGQIRIVGTCLNIEYYTNDEMHVIGNVHCIECQNQVCGGTT